MEKLADFLLKLVFGILEKFSRKKAAEAHAASVRADPGSGWLRRLGGKDARKDSADTKRGDN